MNVARSVSVICPTYNSSKYVINTLRSIAQQSVLPLEVIISDDGSTDDTCSVVEAFLSRTELRWRLLRLSHRGPGGARNEGIRAARGTWIAFIDSDDLWVPEKLICMAQAAEENADANFFCHNQEWHGMDGSRKLLDFAAGMTPDRSVAASLMIRNTFTPSAVVCRRYLFDQFGLFDETLDSAQDYELWLRFSPGLKPCMLPRVLGVYVARRGSITSRAPSVHFRNNSRLLWRHRHKAGLRLYFYAMTRTIMEFLRREWKLKLRKDGALPPRPRAVVTVPPISAFRRIYAAAFFGVNFSAEIVNCSQRRAGTIRVLLFHHVSHAHLTQFAAQLRWLAQKWRFITPQAFTAMLIGTEPASADSLLLTFDDAYKSNMATARQVLGPLGIKAIFFAPADFICLSDGTAQRRFIADRIFERNIAAESLPDDLAPMSIADLAELVDEGHMIGSHTRSHARLSSLSSDAELEEELLGSAEQLQQKLGVKIDNFAFPFGNIGSIGPRALAMSARYYRFVYSGIRGANIPGISPYAIRRDAFQPTDSPVYVDAVLRGGFDMLYAKERRRLDRFAAIAS